MTSSIAPELRPIKRGQKASSWRQDIAQAGDLDHRIVAEAKV
jgi:hypothetical protein